MAKRRAPRFQGWMGARSIPAGCTPRGCTLLLRGKPKAENKRAQRPQPVISHCWGDAAAHSPLPSFRRESRSLVAGTTRSPYARLARGIATACRVYVGPTTHGDSSVPPSLPRRSCSGGFPEPRVRCRWAPGKGTKEPFSSPASPGAEGEGKRKEQCLQNTTIGRKFSSGFSRLGFFLSLTSSF